jgi:hypothetical protein
MISSHPRRGQISGLPVRIKGDGDFTAFARLAVWTKAILQRTPVLSVNPSTPSCAQPSKPLTRVPS